MAASAFCSLDVTGIAVSAREANVHVPSYQSENPIGTPVLLLSSAQFQRAHTAPSGDAIIEGARHALRCVVVVVLITSNRSLINAQVV